MTAIAMQDESIDELIADTAKAIFAEIGPLVSAQARAACDTARWFASGWEKLVETGFIQAMRSEQEGGVGIPAALMIIRLSGAAAVNLPLGEAMGADWLLSRAGMPPSASPAVFVPAPLSFAPVQNGIHISGTVHNLAWARCCELVCIGQIDGQMHLATLSREHFAVTEAANMADEPRDTISVDCVIDASRVAHLCERFDADLPARLGAVLRTAQIAGAAQAAVDMAVGYASERAQFGRTLSRFQAVQQLLAVMAGEAAAATSAVDLASTALAGGLRMEAVAAAKIRSSEAAGRIAAIAHQIHGAIGFTREHALQLLSRRLLSWRDEFGSEFEWAVALGRALAVQPQGLWAAITEF